jgi:DNA-binding CsgD family transcriptional regulator
VEFDKSTFKGFMEKYAEQIRDKGFTRKSYSCFDDYPLLPSQALYIFDMQEMRMPYQRGIQKLFGYSEEEFNFELFNHWYHPDDHDRYLHLLKVSNEWARKLKPDPFSIEASIDYRVRKKDGNYLKILRQTTIFETCFDNSSKSSFSFISDISKIKTNTSINLSLIDLNSGNVIFEEKEKDPGLVQFTKREKEILLKIKEGLNSQSIADEFNCSKHTVDTHRRNMLQKSGCKNTMELINYCVRMGII